MLDNDNIESLLIVKSRKTNSTGKITRTEIYLTPASDGSSASQRSFR
jgi:hypothetical protein